MATKRIQKSYDNAYKTQGVNLPKKLADIKQLTNWGFRITPYTHG